MSVEHEGRWGLPRDLACLENMCANLMKVRGNILESGITWLVKSRKWEVSLGATSGKEGGARAGRWVLHCVSLQMGHFLAVNRKSRKVSRVWGWVKGWIWGYASKEKLRDLETELQMETSERGCVLRLEIFLEDPLLGWISLQNLVLWKHIAWFYLFSDIYSPDSSRGA